jgi:GntR family transcriptional regulator/MocR family aminotransferase
MVRSLDGGRSALEQAAMAEFITEGHFVRHLKRMRVLYRSRLCALVSAVSDVFAARFDVLPASGGLHIVARLRDHEKNDAHIEDIAGAGGLRPLALSKMGQGRCCGQGLLLGFANLPEEEAHSIVRRLKNIIET